MNQLVYNVSLGAGTLLASVGAGLQWGAGMGLMVAGGLVIGLTFASLWVNRSAG